MLLLALTDSIRLEKAFDRVDYDGLIFKLSRLYGVSRSACKLIYSYLVGLSQYICLNDMSSDILPFKSGVPQGLWPSSLLMTYLFSLTLI